MMTPAVGRVLRSLSEATPPDAAYEGMFRMSASEVTALERLMDECQKELPPLFDADKAPTQTVTLMGVDYTVPSYLQAIRLVKHGGQAFWYGLLIAA